MDSPLDATPRLARNARERRAYFLHLLLRQDEDDLPTGPGGWIVPRAWPLRVVAQLEYVA